MKDGVPDSLSFSEHELAGKKFVRVEVDENRLESRSSVRTGKRKAELGRFEHDEDTLTEESVFHVESRRKRRRKKTLAEPEEEEEEPVLMGIESSEEVNEEPLRPERAVQKRSKPGKPKPQSGEPPAMETYSRTRHMAYKNLSRKDEPYSQEDDLRPCFACSSCLTSIRTEKVNEKIEALNDRFFETASSRNASSRAADISHEYEQNIRIPHNREVEHILRQNPDQREDLLQKYPLLPEWTPWQVYLHFESHVTNATVNRHNRLNELSDILYGLSNQLYVRSGSDRDAVLNVDAAEMLLKVMMIEQKFYRDANIKPVFDDNPRLSEKMSERNQKLVPLVSRPLPKRQKAVDDSD